MRVHYFAFSRYFRWNGFLMLLGWCLRMKLWVSISMSKGHCWAFSWILQSCIAPMERNTDAVPAIPCPSMAKMTFVVSSSHVFHFLESCCHYFRLGVLDPVLCKSECGKLKTDFFHILVSPCTRQWGFFNDSLLLVTVGWETPMALANCLSLPTAIFHQLSEKSIINSL